MVVSFLEDINTINRRHRICDGRMLDVCRPFIFEIKNITVSIYKIILCLLLNVLMFSFN